MADAPQAVGAAADRPRSSRARRGGARFALALASALVHLPIFWLAQLVPKDRRLWLFACRRGQGFGENTKYLYEHVLEHRPDVQPLWITKSRKIYRELKGRGRPVCLAYSPAGYWRSMRAGCVFFTHFSRETADFNDFATGSSTLRVQLWHGSPMKAIGAVRRNVEGMARLDSGVRRLARAIFPFFRYRTSCHKMLAASPEVAAALKAAFGLADEHLWIGGYPKNDRWLRAARGDTSERPIKRVLYVPTWRQEGSPSLFDGFGFDAERLDQFCVDNRLEFCIKLHPFSTADREVLPARIVDARRVRLLDTGDIYETLEAFDILVTDYSSIVFDFLLSDRAVVFAAFDLDDYRARDVAFERDYASFTPGPVAYDWPALERALISDLDSYRQARNRLRDRYNASTDTDSSARLCVRVEQQLADGLQDLQPAFHS